MSWSMYIHERISIINNCKEAYGLILRLQEYIRQINHMECLESITDLHLSLSNGVNTVYVEKEEETEFDNTWMVSSKGMRQQHADHSIWPEDHPLIQMLNMLNTASQATLEWSAALMKLSGVDYGNAYWRESIQKFAPTACIDYRTLETDDFSSCAGTFQDRGSGECAEVPRSSSLDSVNDIQKWYANNFEFKIEGVPEARWEAFEAQLEEIHEGFVESFGADYVDVEYL